MRGILQLLKGFSPVFRRHFVGDLIVYALHDKLGHGGKRAVSVGDVHGVKQQLLSGADKLCLRPDRALGDAAQIVDAAGHGN